MQHSIPFWKRFVKKIIGCDFFESLLRYSFNHPWAITIAIAWSRFPQSCCCVFTRVWHLPVHYIIVYHTSTYFTGSILVRYRYRFWYSTPPVRTLPVSYSYRTATNFGTVFHPHTQSTRTLTCKWCSITFTKNRWIKVLCVWLKILKAEKSHLVKTFFRF